MRGYGGAEKITSIPSPLFPPVKLLRGGSVYRSAQAILTQALLIPSQNPTCSFFGRMREYGRVIIIRATCPFVEPQWEREVEGVSNLPIRVLCRKCCLKGSNSRSSFPSSPPPLITAPPARSPRTENSGGSFLLRNSSRPAPSPACCSLPRAKCALRYHYHFITRISLVRLTLDWSGLPAFLPLNLARLLTAGTDS